MSCYFNRYTRSLEGIRSALKWNEELELENHEDRDRRPHEGGGRSYKLRKVRNRQKLEEVR